MKIIFLFFLIHTNSLQAMQKHVVLSKEAVASLIDDTFTLITNAKNSYNLLDKNENNIDDARNSVIQAIKNIYKLGTMPFISDLYICKFGHSNLLTLASYSLQKVLLLEKNDHERNDELNFAVRIFLYLKPIFPSARPLIEVID